MILSQTCINRRSKHIPKAFKYCLNWFFNFKCYTEKDILFGSMASFNIHRLVVSLSSYVCHMYILESEDENERKSRKEYRKREN